MLHLSHLCDVLDQEFQNFIRRTLPDTLVNQISIGYLLIAQPIQKKMINERS